MGAPVQAQVVVVESNPPITITTETSKDARKSKFAGKTARRVCCGCALGCCLIILIAIVIVLVIGAVLTYLILAAFESALDIDCDDPNTECSIDDNGTG